MKRRSGDPSGLLRALMLTGACFAALGACSYVPDVVNPMTWFEDDGAEAAEPAAEAQAQAGAEEEFPSLSSVPEAPADAPEPEEFEQIAEGLSADKENAQYTDDALRRSDDEVSGAVPAAPLAASAPAPSASTVVVAQAAPAPAQPLTSGAVAQGTGAVQPAQALDGAYVQPAAAGATTAATRVAQASGGVAELFSAAYQASGATTLAAAGLPAVPTQAAQPLPAASVLSPIVFPTRQAATVYFGDGSARLGGEAQATLLQVAYDYGRTGGPIRIVGHASAGSGTSRSKLANLDVSMDRAVAVAEALTKLGIPSGAMTLEAASDNAPVSSGDAAQNRRVEIFIGG